ncbi:MAG: PEGA domain-containing protein, partial [Myxococcales bacterium]
YYYDVLGENPTADDRRVVEESLQRLAPRVALLTVESEPPGADVFIERKDLGSRGLTPKTLAVPPGRTRVTVSLAGHRDGEAEVELERGRTAKVKIPLEFIWSTVELAGSPAGAEIRVDRTDGEPAGMLPATLKVKPGRHILNIGAPGYLAAQVPVDGRADTTTQVKIDLQPLPPPTGSLVVTANHEGALVVVDGKDSGFTPAVIALPEGRHRVRVTFEDLDPYEETVTIRPNEMTRVRAELRYAQAKITAASKTETSVDDAPASTTVITRDEILAFGYTTLPEALRWVRGMFLNNDRTYDFIGVRGFSPPGDLNNRILILYDGHPMNDIFAGQAYLGRENNIDLQEVERIEVVRGPVSSLFGSAAFFGVINIVPRHHLGDKLAEVSGAAGALGLGR